MDNLTSHLRELTALSSAAGSASLPASVLDPRDRGLPMLASAEGDSDEGAGGAADGLYPMRAVTRMTGLSADTIRVWERRYGAVTPKRTDGNARRYSGEDVRRLSLLRDATVRGHSISEVARLPEPAIRKMLSEMGADAGVEPVRSGPPSENLDKVTQRTPVDLDSHRTPGETPSLEPRRTAPKAPVGPSPLETSQHARFCAEYLDAISRFEVRRGSDLLAAAVLLLEPKVLVFEVVIPTLREASRRVALGTASAAHEHLVGVQLKGLMTNLVQKVGAAADGPRVLLAAPARERGEFGALVAAFLSGLLGFDPLYLGADVPEQDLASAVLLSDASLLVLGVTRDLEPGELAQLDASLERLGEHAEVWVVVPPGHAARGGLRTATVFEGFVALDAALAQRRSAEGLT